MKTKISIVANWKMNPQSLDEAKKIAAFSLRATRAAKKISLTLCPPFPYLSYFYGKLGSASLGAQDVSLDDTGPATGSVSAAILAGVGVSSVIIGHSERRSRGDSDEIVARKISLVLRVGLYSILCVGERTRDDSGDYLGFIRETLHGSLRYVKKSDLSRLSIAYEPVWAIGKNEKDSLSPPLISETILYIKKILSDMYTPEVVSAISFLYGGSVGVNNAKAIVTEGGVSGLLVGHVSIDPIRFPDLIKSL